jgi:hypothetical protein
LVKDWHVFLLLFVAGATAAILISIASGQREAWDSTLYWSAGLPAMALIAGIAGYSRPHRTWSLGVAVVAGSLAPMIIRSIMGREGASLWPIGFLFAAVLALGCGAAAWLGSRLRRRRASG